MIYYLAGARGDDCKDFCSTQSLFGRLSANVLGLASGSTFNRWWLGGYNEVSWFYEQEVIATATQREAIMQDMSIFNP
tara:strand:+ start:1208 stop:1441 length:234 start_codon:yes stop_codon:yes gene_type:complete